MRLNETVLLWLDNMENLKGFNEKRGVVKYEGHKGRFALCCRIDAPVEHFHSV